MFNGTADPGLLVTLNNGGGLNADLTANGQTNSADMFAGDSGNAEFDQVMDSFAYDGPNPKVLTLNGLFVGLTYRVQLFVSDDRSCCNGRTQFWSDSPTSGAGNESAT